MFPIITVPPDAADLIEQLGTKQKFWYDDTAGERRLFKQVRQDTGEDWSEKVASELGTLLGLPHADYDFATWKDLRGVVTPTFVPDRGRLVLGNELLVRLDSGYPGARAFRVRQHTLRLVLAVLRAPMVTAPLGWTPIQDVVTGLDVFAGYVLLDAWIGNTDRHHENWGLVLSADQTVPLAPTYDHASSLGRNESDISRRERLTTRDQGRSVTRYVERTTSSFFGADSTKPLSTQDAFGATARAIPAAAKVWLDRLAGVSSADTLRIFEEVPPTLITAPAIEFAQRMLELNQQRLLLLGSSL